MSYFYGPVPSRRLGFSLGVDLIPKKVCCFDCLYCQVGLTTKKTSRRQDFCVDLNRLRKELEVIISKNLRIDYITFSGSGEPTLYKNLGRVIQEVKKITKNRYRVCVITNSSLLYRKDVREDLREADLIIPSLDAADSKTFYKINRPAKGITLNKIVDGLAALRKEFKGKIWLEIMLLAGMNDSLKDAKNFKKIIEIIKPDKIQLNLPVRPAPVKVKPPSKGRIDKIKEIIDSNIETVRSFRKKEQKKFVDNATDRIIEYLKRRPAAVNDLSNSLGLDSGETKKYLTTLVKKNEVKKRRIHRKIYYIVSRR